MQSIETGMERKSTRYIVLTRGAFTLSMILVLVLGLAFKLFFPVTEVFGTYCLRRNGTFLRLPANVTESAELALFASTANCTIFTP